MTGVLFHRSQPCSDKGAYVTHEAMSHAIQGYPTRTGHSGEFWQSVVHGEGNGKPLQHSCLKNLMNSMKKQKDMTPRRWSPRSEGVQYAPGEEWRKSLRKNEAARPQQKRCTVVDVSGGETKVQCCKEQYCRGTWNIRSVNQGKSDMVKQEMTRANVHILGKGELKWTGMGKFNSGDHYIYYPGQESLGRNAVALLVNNRLWNAVLGCNLKKDKMILVCFQGPSFNITVIQV